MPKQVFVCPVCGVEFLKYACQAKGAAVYCSLRCSGAAKHTGSTLQCALCDSSFYRRPGEQDVGVRVNQFCSRECYMDWRALNRKSSTYVKTGARHVHRVVAEAVLGRALLPDEVVHHKDEDKHNNVPSNLVVFPSQSDHMRCHQGSMSAAELERFSLIAA